MFTIVRDTREKKGFWDFSPDAKCYGTIVETLNTGDYSILGLESVFTIERKATVSEVAKNIVEDRFEEELKRLALYPYKFIICEFGANDILRYPIGSGLPQRVRSKVKVKGPFIYSVLSRLMVQYNVPILFCSDYARLMAMNIIKNVIKIHENKMYR